MDFLMEHEHHHMHHDFEHLKIAMAQYYASLLTKLKDHIDDHNVHVTLEEKERWNKKADGLSLEELELKLLKKANISDIPTLISELKNDVPYLTAESLNAKLNALDFVTWADLKYKDYITADEVNRLIHNIVIDPSNINLYDYVKKNELATINGQVLYNGGNITVSGGSGSGSGSESGYTLPVATATTLGGIKVGYNANGRNIPVQLNSNNQAYVTVSKDAIVITSDDIDLSPIQTQINNLNNRLQDLIDKYSKTVDNGLDQIVKDAQDKLALANQLLEDARAIIANAVESGGDYTRVLNIVEGYKSDLMTYINKIEGDIGTLTTWQETVNTKIGLLEEGFSRINTETNDVLTWYRTVDLSKYVTKEEFTLTDTDTGTVHNISEIWNALLAEIRKRVYIRDERDNVTSYVDEYMSALNPQWKVVVADKQSKGAKAYAILDVQPDGTTILNSLEDKVNKLDNKVSGFQTFIDNSGSSARLFAGHASYEMDDETGEYHWQLDKDSMASVLALFNDELLQSEVVLHADKITLDSESVWAKGLIESVSLLTNNIQIGKSNSQNIFIGKVTDASTPQMRVNTVESTGNTSNRVITSFDISNNSDISNNTSKTHFDYNGSGWTANKNISWNTDGDITIGSISNPADITINGTKFDVIEGEVAIKNDYIDIVGSEITIYDNKQKSVGTSVSKNTTIINPGSFAIENNASESEDIDFAIASNASNSSNNHGVVITVTDTAGTSYQGYTGVINGARFVSGICVGPA